ncbi:hypothetical protein [Tepidibacter formicigenes]|jgi:hypothetical protein|uniref:Uncharacterized protein n=1 Tax=Tepidibacter formicigenes DSM 15518 TaxID=1123349 RepID=A0A1M6MXF5_9FIRM|nr:hypothetical protein [Tepidibacter formicigenes]SHJ88147.1 hypothetical protein SAMN02744037_01094 [Tepidibacter formicigenes DSM 15518]
MELNKRELELISLSLFRLTIEKRALLGDRKDEYLIKMIEELEKLNVKIDTERLSK